MSRKSEETLRKQKTATGKEIPIPKRGDFFDNLEKVAEKPPKSGRSKRRKKE